MTRPDWTRDPIVPSMMLYVCLATAGFVAIGLGWRIVAGTLVVSNQIPAVVSGGMGGYALVALGAGLARIQTGRRLAARERAEMEDVLDTAALLVEATKGRG